MLPKSLVPSYNGFVGSVVPQNSILGTELGRKLGEMKCEWKFSRDGGAIGSIQLIEDATGLPAQLPAGTIVKNAFVNVKVVPVGAGASIALTLKAAGDVVAAAAITGAPWSTTGLKQGVPVNSSLPAAISLTASGVPVLTISGAVLTAGEIQVFLEYVIA